MKTVDILVVGAGPAGLYCAREASRAGLDVLVVDLKSRIGLPVLCGEFFPSREFQGEPFLGEEVSTFATAIITYCQGEPFQNPIEGALLNRDVWEERVANQARQSGAAIWLNSKFAGLEHSTSASIIRGDRLHQVAFRWLVGADGATSRARRAAGLPPLKLAYAHQTTVKGSDHPGLLEFLLDGFCGQGYAWIFHKERSCHVGLVTDSPKRLKQFAGPFGAAFADDSDQKFTCRAIPICLLGQRVGTGNVLLIGDAAGQVDPLVYGGLAYACEAGLQVGRLLGQRPEDGLAAYTEWYERTLAPRLMESLRIREIIGLGGGWRRETVEEFWPPRVCRNPFAPLTPAVSL